MIKFIGSDADQCYRKRFDLQFQFIMNLWNDDIINLNHLSDNLIMYSNDIFHCLKRLRKRMINNGPLYLKPSDFQSNHCVDKHSLQIIDDTLPDCIFKQGSMISMDDYYPAALFKWSTLEKSRKTNNDSVIFYLWVGVLARKSISDKNLNRKER